MQAHVQSIRTHNANFPCPCAPRDAEDYVGYLKKLVCSFILYGCRLWFIWKATRGFVLEIHFCLLVVCILREIRLIDDVSFLGPNSAFERQVVYKLRNVHI